MQNSRLPDSNTPVRVLPSVGVGYAVAVSAVLSSVRTTVPSNHAPKMASY